MKHCRSLTRRPSRNWASSPVSVRDSLAASSNQSAKNNISKHWPFFCIPLFFFFPNFVFSLHYFFMLSTLSFSSSHSHLTTIISSLSLTIITRQLLPSNWRHTHDPLLSSVCTPHILFCFFYSSSFVRVVWVVLRSFVRCDNCWGIHIITPLHRLLSSHYLRFSILFCFFSSSSSFLYYLLNGRV